MNIKKSKTQKIISRGWTKEETEEEFEYFLDDYDENKELDEHNRQIWTNQIDKGIQKVNNECYRKVEYHDNVPKYLSRKVKVTQEVYYAILDCGHKKIIKESDKRKRLRCRECDY